MRNDLVAQAAQAARARFRKIVDSPSRLDMQLFPEMRLKFQHLLGMIGFETYGVASERSLDSIRKAEDGRPRRGLRPRKEICWRGRAISGGRRVQLCLAF